MSGFWKGCTFSKVLFGLIALLLTTSSARAAGEPVDGAGPSKVVKAYQCSVLAFQRADPAAWKDFRQAGYDLAIKTVRAKPDLLKPMVEGLHIPTSEQSPFAAGYWSGVARVLTNLRSMCSYGYGVQKPFCPNAEKVYEQLGCAQLAKTLGISDGANE